VVNRKRQGGFVAMEAAVWCLMLLPIGLFAVSMYALGHDENVVQILPESLMRESGGRVMTWRSNADQGFFDVNQGRLTSMIEDLRARGAAQLQQTSFKLGDISALACYWVYDVDPATGVVGSAPVAGDCRSSGPLGATLSLDVARGKRLQSGVSRPIVSGGDVVEFVSQVALVGVSVGGRYQGLAEYFREQIVQHGAVWVPREDVTL